MNALTRTGSRKKLMGLAPVPGVMRRFMAAPDWPFMDWPEDMKIDIEERNRFYHVKAEIPGVKKEDIRVNVDGRQVSIFAHSREEKKETKKHDGEGMLLQEMHCGSWSRSFTLPHEVDDAAAEASFANGVLQLTLPKRPQANHKVIAIK